MRGVVLAGGVGSRMGLFTRRVGNKHVIPVYNRPMIEFPLSGLSQAGVKELAIVSSNHHVGDISRLIGDGKEFGFDHVSYFVQAGEGGIAHALQLVESFVGQDKFAVVLGDNMYKMDLSVPFHSFESNDVGCHVFLKKVNDPHRFGIADMDANKKIIGIEEKPQNPKTNYAVTGLYLFDATAFERTKTIKPSARGELEITDVLESYLKEDNIAYSFVDGFWSDMGTPDSLLHTANWLKTNSGILEAEGRFRNYKFKSEANGCGDYLNQ